MERASTCSQITDLYAYHSFAAQFSKVFETDFLDLSVLGNKPWRLFVDKVHLVLEAGLQCSVRAQRVDLESR